MLQAGVIVSDYATLMMEIRKRPRITDTMRMNSQIPDGFGTSIQNVRLVGRDRVGRWALAWRSYGIASPVALKVGKDWV